MKHILTLIALAMVLSACNTINGVGKDLEEAGTAVQKSSK